MNKIHILDCTLRDGGYCNQWNFGYENSKKIVNGLIDSNIEIIECGFITDRVDFNKNVTKFNTISQISSLIPHDRKDKLFVAMINYGEYDIDNLPKNDGSSIDGIRVAFSKNNVKEALEFCKAIKAKGYLVFIQAMVSLSYSDYEFLDMIHEVNCFNPYAFYIVDSFGMMKEKDLTRLFFMVEHNLNNDIWIGFHCHNNMQLAYSNAQRLSSIHTSRNIVIDSSIFGMGRGAGNLNTELFVEYLNENFGKQYLLKPLLTLIDEIISEFYQRNYWGYSLPNYISASHNAHPNYAGYLDDKKTLTYEDMNAIFEMMSDEKKFSFDRQYIEELYLKYLNAGKVQDDHKSELSGKISGRTVLLIGPGKSSVEEKNTIIEFSKSPSVTVFSINFNYDYYKSDFIFVSNLRRFRELSFENKNRCIATSNLQAKDVFYQTKYSELLNDEDGVRDNAVLMAIKFLMKFDIKDIYLAGIDGYSHDAVENYGKDEMTIFTKNTVLDAMNKGMNKVIRALSKDVSIKFLTKPKYVSLEN